MIRFDRERLERIAAVLRHARQRRNQRRRRPDERRGTVPDGMASFRVATWNIHSCVGVDARFAPDRVAEVIRGIGPDLIGLQEIGWHHRGEARFDQFDYLARTTGMTAYAGPTKSNPRAHYGNAVLTRLPVRRATPVDLCIGRREPRGGLDVEVEVDGRVVRVIVAHLGLDPWERGAQIARILALVDQKPDLPTLFMGDFNEWAVNSPRLKRLAQSFDDCASPRSYHARMPTLRLDRMYVRGGLHLASFEVVRTPLTRFASDHLPVTAVMGLGQGTV